MGERYTCECRAGFQRTVHDTCQIVGANAIPWRGGEAVQSSSYQPIVYSETEADGECVLGQAEKHATRLIFLISNT